MSTLLPAAFAALIALLPLAQPARADALHDWNIRMTEIVLAARLPTPAAMRVAALVQTAVYESVDAITGRYDTRDLKLTAARGASIDAAIAAANRDAMVKLLGTQQAAIDAAYQAALGAIADGRGKAEGIAVGQAAAAGVLALRADDDSTGADNYRPHTTAGVYVPTALPVALQWPQRKPWAMKSADEFRPGPPPDLKTARWAADYNEIKDFGSKASKRRSAEQTEIARFWEATGLSLYFPIVRSVTAGAGREVTQNARLLAAAAQAMDDAFIAVFDAKHYYRFWRPITAIRNGDIDGNDATERDPGWLPFIDTPMHPEYPCAHCIQAATVAAVLKAELRGAAPPKLTTTSTTAPGVVRSWTRLEDFVDEVSNARIYDGVHYRFSTEVGNAMGKRVGELAAKRLGLQRLDVWIRRST